jgi:hypothetical protein
MSIFSGSGDTTNKSRIAFERREITVAQIQVVSF